MPHRARTAARALRTARPAEDRVGRALEAPPPPQQQLSNDSLALPEVCQQETPWPEVRVSPSALSPFRGTFPSQQHRWKHQRDSPNTQLDDSHFAGGEGYYCHYDRDFEQAAVSEDPGHAELPRQTLTVQAAFMWPPLIIASRAACKVQLLLQMAQLNSSASRPACALGAGDAVISGSGLPDLDAATYSAAAPRRRERQGDDGSYAAPLSGFCSFVTEDPFFAPTASHPSLCAGNPASTSVRLPHRFASTSALASASPPLPALLEQGAPAQAQLPPPLSSNAAMTHSNFKCDAMSPFAGLALLPGGPSSLAPSGRLSGDGAAPPATHELPCPGFPAPPPPPPLQQQPLSPLRLHRTLAACRGLEEEEDPGGWRQLLTGYNGGGGDTGGALLPAWPSPFLSAAFPPMPPSPSSSGKLGIVAAAAGGGGVTQDAAAEPTASDVAGLPTAEGIKAPPSDEVDGGPSSGTLPPPPPPPLPVTLPDASVFTAAVCGPVPRDMELMAAVTLLPCSRSCVSTDPRVKGVSPVTAKRDAVAATAAARLAAQAAGAAKAGAGVSEARDLELRCRLVVERDRDTAQGAAAEVVASEEVSLLLRASGAADKEIFPRSHASPTSVAALSIALPAQEVPGLLRLSLLPLKSAAARDPPRYCCRNPHHDEDATGGRRLPGIAPWEAPVLEGTGVSAAGSPQPTAAGGAVAADQAAGAAPQEPLVCMQLLGLPPHVVPELRDLFEEMVRQGLPAAQIQHLRQREGLAPVDAADDGGADRGGGAAAFGAPAAAMSSPAGARTPVAGRPSAALMPASSAADETASSVDVAAAAAARLVELWASPQQYGSALPPPDLTAAAAWVCAEHFAPLLHDIGTVLSYNGAVGATAGGNTEATAAEAVSRLFDFLAAVGGKEQLMSYLAVEALRTMPTCAKATATAPNAVAAAASPRTAAAVHSSIPGPSLSSASLAPAAEDQVADVSPFGVVAAASAAELSEADIHVPLLAAAPRAMVQVAAGPPCSVFDVTVQRPPTPGFVAGAGSENPKVSNAFSIPVSVSSAPSTTPRPRSQLPLPNPLPSPTAQPSAARQRDFALRLSTDQSSGSSSTTSWAHWEEAADAAGVDPRVSPPLGAVRQLARSFSEAVLESGLVAVGCLELSFPRAQASCRSRGGGSGAAADAAQQAAEAAAAPAGPHWDLAAMPVKPTDASWQQSYAAVVPSDLRSTELSSHTSQTSANLSTWPATTRPAGSGGVDGGGGNWKLNGGYDSDLDDFGSGSGFLPMPPPAPKRLRGPPPAPAPYDTFEVQWQATRAALGGNGDGDTGGSEGIRELLRNW